MIHCPGRRLVPFEGLTVSLPCAVAMFCAVSAQAVPLFQGLGSLSGTLGTSRATGISADGSVVVGNSSSLEHGIEAFIWTRANGLHGLGDLPGGGTHSQAFGISADGTVVVGRSQSAATGNTDEAIRWTAQDGMVPIGPFAGGLLQSEASAASADGSTIVGGAVTLDASPLAPTGAFRWTAQTGMVGLGDLPGGEFFSVATGTSADGATVVGASWSHHSPPSPFFVPQFAEAFVWTTADGMRGLGDLSGGEFGSFASAVSANGVVVIGTSISERGQEAFRWTESDGMVGLGDLTGGEFNSTAIAVSADGRIIVGESETELGLEAFIWDSSHGMRKLSDVLISYGLSMEGWVLTEANGISYDGTVIVGSGINSGGLDEAYIVAIPEPAIIAAFFIAIPWLRARTAPRY